MPNIIKISKSHTTLASSKSSTNSSRTSKNSTQETAEKNKFKNQYKDSDSENLLNNDEISYLSKRIQDALLENKKIDDQLSNQFKELESQENDKIKTILHQQNEILKWRQKIHNKSPNFSTSQLKEVSKMVNHKKLYMAGTWKSTVNKVITQEKISRVIKRINFNKSIPSQLENLKRLCKEEELDLFEIVRLINEIKMKRCRVYSLSKTVDRKFSFDV